MPRRVITRQRLLDEAFDIAQAEGLSKLSVRRLASRCGVSVGSVYTSFPAKSELTGAVVDRFFGRAVHEDFCRLRPGEGFTHYLRRLDTALRALFQEYSTTWLAEIRALPLDERDACRTIALERFTHMSEGLRLILEDDPSFTDSGLSERVSSEDLCAHIVDRLLDSLHGGTDFSVELVLLEQALSVRPGETPAD